MQLESLTLDIFDLFDFDKFDILISRIQEIENSSSRKSNFPLQKFYIRSGALTPRRLRVFLRVIWVALRRLKRA